MPPVTSYDYPKEYGMYAGETCWRGSCRGRMVDYQYPCQCWDEVEIAEETGEPVFTSVCTCESIVVCGECGASAHDD
jgi:hypothetical protein